MAWWGWLGLLAIPAWLLWITGIGYAMAKQCIEGDAVTLGASTAAERSACHQTPAAWAPTRGLEFGTPELTGEFWLAGLAVAAMFLVVMVLAGRRSARRSQADSSALPRSDSST